MKKWSKRKFSRHPAANRSRHSVWWEWRRVLNRSKFSKPSVGIFLYKLREVCCTVVLSGIGNTYFSVCIDCLTCFLKLNQSDCTDEIAKNQLLFQFSKNVMEFTEKQTEIRNNHKKVIFKFFQLISQFSKSESIKIYWLSVKFDWFK